MDLAFDFDEAAAVGRIRVERPNSEVVYCSVYLLGARREIESMAGKEWFVA